MHEGTVSPNVFISSCRLNYLVKGQYSQGGIVYKIFEVDATAVLCEVSKTAVTHWLDRDREREKKTKLAHRFIRNLK